MKKRYSRKHICEAIAYWKKQLKSIDESSSRLMLEDEYDEHGANVGDFVKEIIFSIPDVKNEFYVTTDGADSMTQWFNINYSTVNHSNRTVTLGATVVDDDPESDYLSTVQSLVEWLNANKVKSDYSIIFEDTNSDIYDRYELKGYKVILY